MATITVERLGKVGARVEGVDADRLLHDDSVAPWCLEALETHGALVFPEVHVDDATQVAFTRKLGTPLAFGRGEFPEIMLVSLDPTKNPTAEYLRGTVEWHIDGAQDEVPAMATLLSAKVVAERGGETEFASTYAAYDALPDDLRGRVDALRVVHSFEAANRLIWPDPTEEQLTMWRKRAPKEHPLVWRHRDGRRSLVLGATTDHVVGMDPADGRALLDDLLARSTAPERVYRHGWAVGDLVIWDNRGVLHRALPYRRDSARDMHRTTIKGDEPVA